MELEDEQEPRFSWAAKIPESWQVQPLKRLLRGLIAGGTPDTSDPDLWADEGGVPWVSIGDMTREPIVRMTEKRVTQRALEQKGMRILPAGTLLYSMYASLGKVARLGMPAVTNQAIVALLPDGKRLDADFLRWWLIHFEQFVSELSNGNTQDNLNATKVRSIPVFVPPKDTQRAIAALLDGKTAVIDALIAKKERLLALLAEKRQALITQAVTKGLDPSVPMKESGVEWAELLPAHWNVLPIKRLARLGARTFTDGDWIEAPFITDAGVRLIQTGNIGVGVYKEQGFRYVSEETFAALRCTEVTRGDVLICRLDGPVGRACLAPDLGSRMITSVDNAILKVADEHDPRYFVYALSTPRYLDWVQSICRVGGGFRFRISRSMLGEFRVPVPPREEQSAIADELDRRSKALLVAERNVERSVEKLREYRQALITAAVTGQIDVTKEWAA